MQLFRRRLSTKRLSVFLHELVTTLDAGIPIVRCFGVIARRARQPVREICEVFADGLQRGHTLSQMIQAEGPRFPRHYAPLIACAEMSGTLVPVLALLAKEADDRLDWTRRLVRAVTYPAAVSVAAIVVIPYIKGLVLSALGGVSMLAFTLHFAAGILSGVATPLGFWFAGRALLRIRPMARAWDTLLDYRYIPFMATRRKLIAARLLRVFGFLLNAGLDVPQSLVAAAETTGNLLTQERARKAVALIKQGYSLPEAVGQSVLLKGYALAMLEVGDISGKAGDALVHAARQLHDEAAHTVIIALAVLEPILIVLVAVFVVMPALGGLAAPSM